MKNWKRKKRMNQTLEENDIIKSTAAQIQTKSLKQENNKTLFSSIYGLSYVEREREVAVVVEQSIVQARTRASTQSSQV